MALRRLLRALGDTRCLAGGRTTHARLLVSGLLPDVVSSNRIISMYAEFGRLDDARKVFDRMPQRNVVSWTVMVSAYQKFGRACEAVGLARSMVSAGVDPNHYTYVGLLSSCANVGVAWIGKEIHGRIFRVEQGVASDFVGNSLINFYAKCGMMLLARRVFDTFTHRNLVSWGSILSGYIQCGENEEAFRILLWARKEGVEVNEYMITSLLSACADLRDSTCGKQLHCLSMKSGNGSDRYVEAGIVDMYVKCDRIDLARQTFSEMEEPGLASWAALIGGYVRHDQGEKAMILLGELHQFGLQPNEHIFPLAFVACSTMGTVRGGEQLHSLIIKVGFRISAHIGNAIVDFYAKCGLFDEASKIFEHMEEKDVVSWNSMIDGHVKQKNFANVRNCLKTMSLAGLHPDQYTYSSILSLCADLAGMRWGSEAHSPITKLSLDTHVVVGSALVDMYAKCGNLKYADEIFKRMPLKNLVSWNSILVGYAQHGFGAEALEIFKRMQEEDIKPNDITYIGVLSACSHVGLVEQGQHHFQNMKDHGIVPRIDHYSCMVDLYARTGQTKIAYEFIQSMPMKPNKVIWRALLSGCKTHGDLETGMHAAKCTLELDPEDTAANAMLSGICADMGMWYAKAGLREAATVRSKEVPGCSWI